GSSYIAEQREAPGPVLPALRKRYPGLDDEERMLRYFFDGGIVDSMNATTGRDFSIAKSPLVELVRQACARRGVARVFLAKGDFKVELNRNR
ncbi:MAG: hypothetical protein DWQ08_13760, partial [Proteobacteria bacterium]